MVAKGEIRYSITEGNGEGKFAIDAVTGDISVDGTLNYETAMSYSLTIVAESIGSASVTGTATQVINVLDVNESPYFVTACANSNSGCSFMIAENKLSGTPVGSIAAMDPDLSNVANGMLIYRFDVSTTTPPFAVDQNGQITTTESLDRENRESYTLTLVVADSCIPSCSLSIETTVSLTITDENDNAPSFIQGPTMVQVSENSAIGFIVAQYIAEDRDSGTNADIVYSLSSSSGSLPFSVHPETGVLDVSGTVDYEATQSYTVTIAASNPDGTQTTVTTVIEVLNLNDNTPTFVGNPYSWTITEHSTTKTITVLATDDDLGDFGEVRYIIIDGNFQNSFSINSVSGVISIVGDIDRETIASVNLTIRARDLILPRRRATGQVTVTITDINDNSPDFLNDPYTAQVREDISIPFNILQVMAFDNDERGNVNSEIVYNITGGNTGGAFAIDESSGQIQAVQSLDFETTQSYTLELSASDRGNPVMSDTTTLTINVVNVNEDPPMLNGSQAVEISELASIGNEVAVFSALDPDNNPVEYTISSGNSENKFNIGNTSGVIVLIDSLDYETTTSYRLEIVASDGQQSTSALLNITVLDENEFSPEFQGGATFSVNEEELDGTLVGTVMATDADGDPANNQVTYSFVQQTSHFTINPSSGEIRTVGVLNREMLTQVFVPPASELTLDVTAQDSASPPKQTTRSITIKLVDINDNSPLFSESTHENSLLENQPAQSVFEVAATDMDLGVNAEITYSFSLNKHAEDMSLFTIDPDTGVLSTADALDCERQSSYNFTIVATDLGNPPQSSTAQGVLYILDENDNAPVFTMNVYEKSVSEDFQTMQSLIQVIATDADKEMNGQVRYSIVDMGLFNIVEDVGDTTTYFSINETSGVLMPQSPFDYENFAQVNLTVTAFDLGLPRRSSTATVVFNVINVDEAGPRFVSQSCDTFIVEEVPPLSFVTLCEAVDTDSVAAPGEIAITYAIIGGNEEGLFEINPTTGEIQNSKLIDSDNKNIYSIEIEAVDLVNQVVRRTVDIFVRDINDNAPLFDRDSYFYHFTDTSIRNYVQSIATIRASDPDNGFNGTIRYSLALEDVVRVSDKETVVTIVATDQGTPPLVANTTLFVTFDTDCLLQEYQIDAVSGEVRAFVLCQIEIAPSSLRANLGSSGSGFFCSALHNSRLTYQWIHNSSLITLPTLFRQGNTQVGYTLTNAQFDHSGEYACKVTTQAGSLQTTSRTATIQGKILYYDLTKCSHIYSYMEVVKF